MAFANISEWAADNLLAIQIGGRGTGGYMAGFGNLTTASTGQHSPMRLLTGSLRAPIVASGAEFVDVPGDGSSKIARFARESSAPNYILEMNAFDLVFEAFQQGSTVYTLGEWDMGARGASNRTRVLQPNILLLTRAAASLEGGTRDEPGYEHLLVLDNQLVPLGDDQMAYNEIGGARYSGSIVRSTKTPWGVTTQTAFALADCEVIPLTSQYPLTMECFVGDNSIVAVPLTYAPISAAKTKGFTFSTGAAKTVSSVDSTAKTATVSAAGASGAIEIYLYEASDLL